MASLAYRAFRLDHERTVATLGAATAGGAALTGRGLHHQPTNHRPRTEGSRPPACLVVAVEAAVGLVLGGIVGIAIAYATLRGGSPPCGRLRPPMACPAGRRSREREGLSVRS